MKTEVRKRLKPHRHRHLIERLDELNTERAKTVPRRSRQIAWLGKARQRPILLQVEGGVSYDRDLQELVSRGFLQMSLHRYEGLNKYPLSRTVLILTDKGEAAVNKGRIG